MVAPFLITLYLGGFEISRYIKTMRKVTYVANSVAQMLAQNTTGTVTDTDLHFFVDSAMVTFPDVLSNSYAAGIPWYQDIQTSMSSVAFTPTKTGCTSNCTYKAKVVWNSGPNPRSCTAALTSVSNTAAPTTSTLPADTFGPGSLIVVDVVYTYRPVVATKLFGNLRIARSVYIQPRYVGEVDYDDDSGTKGHSC